MKRYLIDRMVTDASGTQTFYVDAKTKEEAIALHLDGQGGIYADDTATTGLGSPELSGETTLADFGDYPPDFTFDPGQSFDSVAEALTLIHAQNDPMAALLAVVTTNIRYGEFGFVTEVVRDFPTGL